MVQCAARMKKSCPSSTAVGVDLPALEGTSVVVGGLDAKVPAVATVEWADGSSRRLDVLPIGSNVGAC